MGLLPFVLAFAVCLPQSAPVVATEAPSCDLVVGNHYWGKIRTRAAPATRIMRPRAAARARRPGVPRSAMTQRETYALVRNEGTRKVKAVTWDYVFYEDEARERELRRYRFRSKEKIAPGEMKFLTVAVEESAPSAYAEVVVEAVEYEDGSVWRRPSG